MDTKVSGFEPQSPEAFFCFHLLGVASQSTCHELIEKLLRSDDDAIDRCTGEVTESIVRALITSLADQDDPAAFCDWVDSLVQDGEVNQYGKLHAVNSLFFLVAEEVLEDVEAVRLVRKWLDDRKELKQDEFSSMVVAELIDIGGKDLKELAIECFKRGQINEGYVSVDCLDEMSDERQIDSLREGAEGDRRLRLDPISYLKHWHAFAWTTDDFDPQSAAYEPIAESLGWRDSEPDAKEIEQWLAEMDGSSYEVYPHAAIENSHRFVRYAIEKLKMRARRGVEWAQQGKSFSSNAPYLSALMLA